MRSRCCGELSERGKQVWRSGSGINGGGGSDVALLIVSDAGGGVHFAPHR